MIAGEVAGTLAAARDVKVSPYRGLLALNVMLNNSDLKADNNTLYHASDAWPHPGRWFVVRDLGVGGVWQVAAVAAQPLLEPLELGYLVHDVHEAGCLCHHTAFRGESG